MIIRDSGAPPISGTNTLTVVIGDGRHDDGRHWRRERQHSSSRTQTRAGIHLPRYSMTSSTDLLIICVKMNDLDLCLEVFKVMSTIASHSPLNIDRKALEVEACFQRTTDTKWPMGNSVVT